jgi:hypothetical protein
MGRDRGIFKDHDLQDAYIYRYGADLYLVNDSDTEPDLSFKPGTLWPFIAFPPAIAAEIVP